MDKEQENQFKENIKEIARLELKNSFNNNLMETLNSAFIFKYVDTLEKQSQKYKEVIDTIKMRISARIKKYQQKIDNEIDMGSQGDYFKICRYEENIKFLKDILKEVE